MKVTIRIFLFAKTVDVVNVIVTVIITVIVTIAVVEIVYVFRVSLSAMWTVLIVQTSFAVVMPSPLIPRCSQMTKINSVISRVFRPTSSK